MVATQKLQLEDTFNTISILTLRMSGEVTAEHDQTSTRLTHQLSSRTFSPQHPITLIWTLAQFKPRQVVA